jgi:heat shock protein HslJ
VRIALIRSTVALSLVGLLVGACAAPAASPSVSPGASVPAMQGKPWLWTSSTIAEAPVITDPTKYTITFATDGTFEAKVDCNQVAGTYTATDSGAATITPGPATLAACPEGSLADVFLAGLTGVTSYEMSAGQLVLTAPNGTMTFN